MNRCKRVILLALGVSIFAAGCNPTETSADDNHGTDILNSDDTNQDTQPDTSTHRDTAGLRDSDTPENSDTLQDSDTPEDSAAPCVLPNGDTYELGVTWMHEDGCNDCTCKENQRIACSDKTCEPPPSCTVNGIALEEGETYYDGCNSHTCGANGMVASTDRECAEYCLVGDAPFSIGEIVFDGCNFLSCNENGPSSTMLECFPSCKTADGVEIQYGEFASIGDERCECLKFGELICFEPTPAADWLCPGPEIGDESFDYAIDATWEADDKCNECKCLLTGEIVCTEQECAPAAACRYDGETLIPGEVRFDGFCDYHTCESDGSISQTDNGC